MIYLVTGAAGFIGYHTAAALLDRGAAVVGVDSLNDYYSPELKRARLARLKEQRNFTFHQLDIAQPGALRTALAGTRVSRILHLAAQAGVRYSLENPQAYVHANVLGQVEVLEYARGLEGLDSLTYASSSSVYGGNNKMPFAEGDRVDNPMSLYAATKKSGELIANVYAGLYRMPATGLRFFTVYGPWGRPDMAMWLFTEAIMRGWPIRVFNGGDMARDFTYVDDIVAGILAVSDSPMTDEGSCAPHRVYNVGNNQPEPLSKLIEVLEFATGRKAVRQLEPMQPGDVPATYADISAIARDHGFAPRIPLEVGARRFVEWYRSYHGL